MPSAPGHSRFNLGGALSPLALLPPEPAPPIGEPAEPKPPRTGPRCRYWRWAELMRLTLGLPVDRCPHCGGRMKLRAPLRDPETIERFLRHQNLWTEPLGLAEARPPPSFRSVTRLRRSPQGRALRVGRSEPAGHRSGQRAPVVRRLTEIGEKVRRREGRFPSQPGPAPRSRPSLRPPHAPLNRVRSAFAAAGVAAGNEDVADKNRAVS